MDIISFLIKLITHPREIIESIPTIYSYILLFFIIFAESGFLFGFFLPGDALLFTVGFLASLSYNNPGTVEILNIGIVIPLLLLAAVLGDNLGYYTGKKYGVKLFKSEDNFIFKKRHLEVAKKYYDKRGNFAIVLARFVPAVRTFAPIVAGMVGMDRKLFMKYNFIGGFIWVVGLTLLGFYTGALLDKWNVDIDKILLPFIAVIVLASFGLGYLESRHAKKEHLDLPEVAI